MPGPGGIPICWMQAALSRRNVRKQIACLAMHSDFLGCLWFERSLDSSPLRPLTLSRADLCVTEGAIAERIRPWAFGDGSEDASLSRCQNHTLDRSAFQIPRPNREMKRGLGSGELRHQFGLKLRAQDACNLVYAMWRIEPESKLVVSVKTNPGEHSSAECGNRGYQNIKPRRSSPVPKPASGRCA